jgi:hypothetical protein
MSEDLMLSEVQQFVKGLREMADFYEKYQGTPLPPTFLRYLGIYGSASPAQLVQIAKAQGAVKTEKEYSGDLFTLRKLFSGGLGLTFTLGREQVCTKRVTGTREVPETIVPAQVVAAHTEEVVEWDCHPLLAPPEPKELPADTTPVLEGELVETEDIPF